MSIECWHADCEMKILLFLDQPWKPDASTSAGSLKLSQDQSRNKSVSPHQLVSPALVLIPTVLRPGGIRLRPSHVNPALHPHFFIIDYPAACMRSFSSLAKEVTAMNETLLRSWWIPALRGVIAIAFGVLALMWPGLTLLALVSLFAAYALLSGAISIFGAIRNRKRDDEWWLLLLLGLVGVGAGVIALIHPGLTTLVLVLLIGANAMVTGVLDIAAAIRLRKAIQGEWLLVLSGIASVVFGILVFLFPAAGALALVWMISVYAVVTGVLLLAVAFRLRARAHAEAPDRRVTRDRRVTPVHAHT
jgi:uncharacterized membrane protein HdeD (DUF308 family)